MFWPHEAHGLHVTVPVSLAKYPSGHAGHDAAPEWFTAVPAPHGVCSVLPVGAKWPASVAVHSSALVRSVAFEYDPSAQGSEAPAPSGQYEPGSQASHACLPSSGWYLPGAHLAHAPMLALGANVPGLHGVCAVLPVGAKWPGSAGVHSTSLVRFVAVE